jgi:hypothetical protein
MVGSFSLLPKDEQAAESMARLDFVNLVERPVDRLSSSFPRRIVTAARPAAA